MISSQAEGSLKLREQANQHDKKQSVFRLLRSNFEILIKQVYLSELLGSGLQLHTSEQDEFLASHIAIELMLTKSLDQKNQLFEHLDELISARFFEQFYATDSYRHQSLPLELAQQFSDLLECVALKVTQEWSQGGMGQFLLPSDSKSLIHWTK